MNLGLDVGFALPERTRPRTAGLRLPPLADLPALARSRARLLLRAPANEA